METINWCERHEQNREDFAAWLIISALTTLGDRIDWKSIDGSKLEVVFQVNGRDLPFVETVQAIEKQLDRLVRDEAAKVVEQKIGDARDALADLVQEARRVLRSRLGVECEDEYR